MSYEGSLMCFPTGIYSQSSDVLGGYNPPDVSISLDRILWRSESTGVSTCS